MPTPKRWHPVSRDLNEDPELWAFTDQFGDRYLRLWLEILALLDRHDNHWRVQGDWVGSLARKCRLKPGQTKEAVIWLVDNEWIVAVLTGQQTASKLSTDRQQTASKPPADRQPTISQCLTDGLLLVMSSRNYSKFHKTREASGAKHGTLQTPSYPNLPYPNLRSDLKVPVGSGDNSKKGLTRVASGITEFFKNKMDGDDEDTLATLREEPMP